MAKKVTQSTFDAAVSENVEEFGMSPEEALADAISQFQSQGVDLSGIIKHLPGEGGRLPDFHRLADVLGVTAKSEGAASEGAAAAGAETGGGASSAEPAPAPVSSAVLVPLLEKVAAQLLDKDVSIYAGQHNALPLLITAAQRAAALGGEESSAGLKLAFVALSRLLDGQPDLLSPPPGKLTEEVIVQDLPPNAATKALCALVKQFVAEAEVVAAGLHAVVHACIKHEVNRQAFVDNGIVDTVMDTLRKHTSHPVAAGAAGACLRALTLDDDVRVPFGKAHSTARMIVAEGDGLALLVTSLKALQADASAVPSLASTISRLAVRNEFCQEIVDLGGTAAALEAMNTHGKVASVQQACCSLLRAVAGNDLVKTQLSASGGIDAIVSAMQAHFKVAGVAEQGCAALAALCLRNEGNCRQVVGIGGASVVAHAMQAHPTNLRVQRQACQALRNMVARTPELRDAILANGVEEYVRAAMAALPGCGDVAKGALRDLGCQVDLKELWTGTAGLGAVESQPIDDGGEDL